MPAPALAVQPDEILSDPALESRAREISQKLASTAFHALFTAPIERRATRRLLREAWRVADELGWAKAYDAEYVALARTLGCKLFTVDERLRRGAHRIVPVIGPRDL